VHNAVRVVFDGLCRVVEEVIAPYKADGKRFHC
jgi:hypothetical protein